MKNFDLGLTIKTLTLRAIIKKNLSHGHCEISIIQKIFNNSCFQSIEEKYGQELAFKLLMDLVHEERETQS